MSSTEENSVTEWIQKIDIPAALISYSYRAVQKKFAKELAPYHIGWGHFAILMSLYENEGCSQDELALSRGFDKTMIAKSVVRLEEEDFIQRKTDPADKRVKRLYLTERSRKLIPEIEQIGFGINEILFKDFDKKESKIILEYLRKISLNASEM